MVLRTAKSTRTVGLLQSCSILLAVAGGLTGCIMIGRETEISVAAVAAVATVVVVLVGAWLISLRQQTLGVVAQWFAAVLTVGIVILTVFSLGWFLAPAAALSLLAAVLLSAARLSHQAEVPHPARP